MARPIERSMLKGNYNWEGFEQKGSHDDLPFNRQEGNEISAMIQAIMNQGGFDDPSYVHRIEDLIADELPGNIGKKDKVKQWLLERLAPENSAVSYIKTLSGGLGFPLSESSGPPELFNVAIPSDAGYAEVLDGLLDLARHSSLVKSYGTTDHYDPDVDYFDTKGITPLFPGEGISRQGWYEEMDTEQLTESLAYYNAKTETQEEVGEQIFEIFDESTKALSALVIYNDPERFEQNRAGVYLLGGIDNKSGRLVGFMIQNVAT